MTSNADIVRSGYDAFAQADIPGVLDLLAADITWHTSGRSPLAGVHNGHEGVLMFFQMHGERSDGTFSLDVHDILDNGRGTVIPLVTEHAQRNGARAAFDAAQIWTVHEGKATHFQDYVADDYAHDDFWS